MNDYSYKKKVIKLPSKKSANWKIYLSQNLNEINGIGIELDCNDWNMKCKDLKEIVLIAKEQNNYISIVRSRFPETVVSAFALSLKGELILTEPDNTSVKPPNNLYLTNKVSNEFIFHQGTLRSGELLESDGNLMILGDVNPGAMVRANENIMIWGRLLGTAHAGKSGNINSKISALQLRPRHLRIADKIARGPKEKPEIGIAEQAEIQSGQIIITPLKT